MDLKQLDAKPIYLDYAATTPVDPRVVHAMLPFLYENFGNPASRSHAYGWAATSWAQKTNASAPCVTACWRACRRWSARRSLLPHQRGVDLPAAAA